MKGEEKGMEGEEWNDGQTVKRGDICIERRDCALS